MRFRLTTARPLTSVRLRETSVSGASRDGANSLSANESRNEEQDTQPPGDVVSNAEIVRQLESIQQAVVQIEDARQQSLFELQQLAIDLAISLASRVVYDVYEAEQADIEPILKTLLGDLRMDGDVTVSLHPADCERLRELASDESQSSLEPLRFRPDPQLERGDYRIDTDGESWISRVADRLSGLRCHLIEGLDDAQTERRTPEAADRGIRRYPDRRGIA